jgi:hypothetical protein
MAFIEKEYDVDAKSTTIAVGGDALEFDTAELGDEMRTTLMLHGLNQKMGDACASIKGAIAKATGRETKEVTDDEVKPKAIAALRELWAQLVSGDWRAAKGEGEAKPRVGEVAQAIARLQSIPVEQAQALVAQVDKEKLAKWRAHPQMKLAIAQIRQEKAAAKLAAEMAKAEAVAEFNPND